MNGSGVPPALTDSDHSSRSDSSGSDDPYESNDSDEIDEEAAEGVMPGVTGGGTSDYGSRSGHGSGSNSEAEEEPPQLEGKTAEELKKEGNVKFQDGDYVEAIKKYEDAIKFGEVDQIMSKDDIAKCYSNIAHCHNKRKESEEALKAAFKAISIKPEFHRPYVRCATAFLNKGKPKLQIMALWKAKAYNPTDKEANDELGRIDSVLITECKGYLLRAYDNNPKNIDLNKLNVNGFVEPEVEAELPPRSPKAKEVKKKLTLPSLPGLCCTSNEEDSPSSDEDGGRPKRVRAEEVVKKKKKSRQGSKGSSKGSKGRVVGDSSSEDEGVGDKGMGKGKKNNLGKTLKKEQLKKEEEDEKERLKIQEAKEVERKRKEEQKKKEEQEQKLKAEQEKKRRNELDTRQKAMASKDPKEKLWLDYTDILRVASKSYMQGIMTGCMDKMGEALVIVQRDFPKLKYKKSFNNCEEVVVIKFMFARASTECGNYQEILTGYARLTEIVTNHSAVRFPAVHLGFALLYKKLNRHEMALQSTEKGLAYLDNKSLPAVTFSCPGLEAEPLLESIPDNLLSKLSDLRLELRCPPKPDAICKYASCLKAQLTGRIQTDISPSGNIFLTDPDYRGHIKVCCRLDCCLDYHEHCWSLVKTEHKEVMKTTKTPSEKDFFGRPCFTPDCEGLIIKIQIFESDGHEIKIKELEDKKLIEKIENDEKIKKKEEKEKKEKEEKEKSNRKMEEKLKKDKKKKKERSHSISEKESSPDSITEEIKINTKPKVVVPANLPSVESYTKSFTPPPDIPLDHLTILPKKQKATEAEEEIDKSKKPKKNKEKTVFHWEELKPEPGSVYETGDYQNRLEKLASVRESVFKSHNFANFPPVGGSRRPVSLEDHIDGYIKNSEEISPEIVDESVKIYILQTIVQTLTSLGPLKESDKRLLGQFDHQAKETILKNSGLLNMVKFDERIGSYADVLFVKGLHDPQKAKEIKEKEDKDVLKNLDTNKNGNNLGAVAKMMREKIETIKNQPIYINNSKENDAPATQHSQPGFSTEKVGEEKWQYLERIRNNADLGKEASVSDKMPDIIKRDLSVQTDVSSIDLEEHYDIFSLRQTNTALIEEVQDAKDKLSKVQNERKVESKEMNDKLLAAKEEKKALQMENSKLIETNAKMQKTHREAVKKEDELRHTKEKLEAEKSKSAAFLSDLNTTRTKLHAEGRLTYELKAQLEASRVQENEARILKMKCLKIEYEGILKLLRMRKKEIAALLQSLGSLPANEPTVRSAVDKLNEHSAILYRREDELRIRYQEKVRAGTTSDLDFDCSDLEAVPALSSGELDTLRLLATVGFTSRGASRETVAPFNRPPPAISPARSTASRPPGRLGPPPGLTQAPPPVLPDVRPGIDTGLQAPRPPPPSGAAVGSGRPGASSGACGTARDMGPPGVRPSGAEPGPPRGGQATPKMKSSHVKLIEELRRRNPNLSVEDANRYISRLRASNGGKLSGLSHTKIYERVDMFYLEDRQQENSARQAETSGPEECPICMEPMTIAPARALQPCGHLFHNACINTWLTSDNGAGNTCPNCRNYNVQEDEFPDLGQMRRGGRNH